MAQATGFPENEVSLKNIFQQVFKASQTQGVTSSFFHLLNRWKILVIIASPALDRHFLAT